MKDVGELIDKRYSKARLQLLPFYIVLRYIEPHLIVFPLKSSSTSSAPGIQIFNI